MADFALNNGGILDGSAAGDGSTNLSRDIYVETLEAFNRSTIFKNLCYVQTIASGKAGQFIVGGKTTNDGATEYTYDGSTGITYGEGSFGERTIVLQKPLYTARVIDQFEERVAHYDVRSIITNQMGEQLANKLDQDIASKLFTVTTSAGIKGNPDEVAAVEVEMYTTTTNALTPSTVEAAGDLLAEAIFEAKAGLEGNDDMGEAYCVLSPKSFSYLVQSKKAVNADYSAGNGSFAKGTVMEVGGVKVFKSNNIPSADIAGGNLGVVFTREAVGVLELVGLRTNQETDIDMLDATKMTAYYMNGIDVLRPESKIVIKDSTAS